MSSSDPERYRASSRWQAWFLQLSASAAIVCGILMSAEAMGAKASSQDLKQQQEYNQRHDANAVRRAIQAKMMPVGYTSDGVPLIVQPDLIIENPSQPLEPLQRGIDTHRKRSADYGWLGFAAVFGFSSTLVSAGATRRRRRHAQAAPDVMLPEPIAPHSRARRAPRMPIRMLAVTEVALQVGEPGHASHFGILGKIGLRATSRPTAEPHSTAATPFDPIAPAVQIDSRYVHAFAPTIYRSSTYGSESIVFDQMMDRYVPTLTERLVHRVRTALAARHEAIDAQLAAAAAAPYDGFATYHNTIDPMPLDLIHA